MLSYLEFFFRCLLKITWLQLEKRYRVMHVNNMPDFFVFCSLLPKRMGAKVILDIHDPMPNTFASKFQKEENGLPFKLLLWEQQISASFADQVITVHDPIKDQTLFLHLGDLRTQRGGRARLSACPCIRFFRRQDQDRVIAVLVGSTLWS